MFARHRRSARPNPDVAARQPTDTTVAKVLYAAPFIMELLCPQSRAALSACSRDLRSIVHSTTKVLTVSSRNDVRHVANGTWPSLSLIIAPNSPDPANRISSWPQHSKLDLLAVFVMRKFSLRSTAYILSAKAADQQSYAVLASRRCRLLRLLRQLHISPYLLAGWHATELLQQQDTTQSRPGLSLQQHSVQTACCHLSRPVWQQTDTLDILHNPLGPLTLSELCKHGYPSLTHLSLCHMRLDAASIAACFRSNCSQLVTLALRHSKLDSEAVAELSRAHQLVAHLRHLYMSNTHLSIAAMTQLSMGNWPSLEQLDLSNSRLDAASIARLATGGWPKLTRLNLNSNWLDASAMMELTHGSWPQLQSLDLSGNRLDDAAVAQMASGHWPQLSSLNLYKNKQVTVLSVADATQITSITMLYLDRTNARTFVQSAVLLWQKQTRVGNALRSESTNLSVSHLQLLNLQSSSLGVCDIAVLVAMALPHLKHLSLHNNPLNEAAIHELIKGHWPELVVLGLSDCTLDNAVLKVLCQGQWLKLQKLYLSSNDIDVVGVQHLQSSWPDLSELELSKRVLSAAGWNAMGLAPDDISQWTHGIAGHGICVARLDQSVDGGIWPELKYVHFPREVTGVSQQEAHSAFWVLTASVLFAVVVLPAVVAFVNTVDIM